LDNKLINTTTEIKGSDEAIINQIFRFQIELMAKIDTLLAMQIPVFAKETKKTKELVLKKTRNKIETNYQILSNRYRIVGEYPQYEKPDKSETEDFELPW